MTRKQGNGEGSVYQLKNKKWMAAIVVGYRNGKPVRKTKTCISKAETRKAVKKLQSESVGLLISDSPTLQEFSIQWQAENEMRDLAPNTITSYRSKLKTHILPGLGAFELSRIRPVDAQSWVNTLAGNGVGASMIVSSFRVLSSMLKRAVQLELLHSNPCQFTKIPKKQPANIKPFTIEESKRIIEYGESGQYPGIWRLAFQTGTRISELFGLHWSEVDFDKNEVEIIQQLSYGKYRGLKPPKSSSGIRTLMIGNDVMEILNEQRKMNVKNGHGATDHVFCGLHGGWVWINTFHTSTWVPMLEELGIKHRGFHHIRHTYATLALAKGVPITTVSQVLGHANPSITLTTYAHAIQQEQSQSVQAMKHLFG